MEKISDAKYTVSSFSLAGQRYKIGRPKKYSSWKAQFANKSPYTD